MVDTVVTNYCNMCLGKLFQYAQEVFEGCTLFDYMWQDWEHLAKNYFVNQCFFGNNRIERALYYDITVTVP